ncbi:conserved hypothetical protein [Agrobacterium sp. NCPPB 925]|nr:conserved hypothetical protein [Agrobacterium sp. NCPPB 925]
MSKASRKLSRLSGSGLQILTKNRCEKSHLIGNCRGCGCYTTLANYAKEDDNSELMCKMKARILDIIRSIFNSTFSSVLLFSCLNFTNLFLNVEIGEALLS